MIISEAYEEDNNGFPSYKDFIPKRPVNLETSDVQRRLKERNILLPWQILETACASLNAGKHVIFTGPPGCGKTTLAKELARAAGIQEPIIATASPTWSTDELIGRYMPAIEGSAIRFSEGFFLRAISDDKWLIIDELNRADIDSCFGELFTVLAGQPAILPFEKPVENEEESSEKKLLPIVVLPESYGKTNNAYKDHPKYSIQSKFRIIGTMNDADASRLNQLSYAFQRRFNIIRVEAPSHEETKEIVIGHTKNKIKSVEESGNRSVYQITKNKNEKIIRHNIFNKDNLIKSLFYNDRLDGFDLVKERVIGIAQVLDVIDFIIEGLTGPNDANLSLMEEDSWNSVKQSCVVYSYMALGLTISVFPQLIALTGFQDKKKLKDAIELILESFKDYKFYRIEGPEKQEAPYRAICDGRKISKFLQIELERLFRNTQLDEEVKKLIIDQASHE
nr:AAA family ATPase [Pelovirga terrestris]